MAPTPEPAASRTRESADHSMPYTVAVALIHGEIEEKHFGDVYLRDPRILALTQRVKAKATEEADRRMPEAMLCRMELVTRSGETDAMTLKAESASVSEAIRNEIASTLRAVTKLGGAVELVPPKSLPNDGKVISDERGTQ